jgi:hypothetical protein
MKYLTSTWWETEYRVSVHHATNGAHIVVYWAHKFENVSI